MYGFLVAPWVRIFGMLFLKNDYLLFVFVAFAFPEYERWDIQNLPFGSLRARIGDTPGNSRRRVYAKPLTLADAVYAPP